MVSARLTQAAASGLRTSRFALHPALDGNAAATGGSPERRKIALVLIRVGDGPLCDGYVEVFGVA